MLDHRLRLILPFLAVAALPACSEAPPVAQAESAAPEAAHRLTISPVLEPPDTERILLRLPASEKRGLKRAEQARLARLGLAPTTPEPEPPSSAAEVRR